jgi:hypothetical protein
VQSFASQQSGFDLRSRDMVKPPRRTDRHWQSSVRLESLTYRPEGPPPRRDDADPPHTPRSVTSGYLGSGAL